MRVSPVAVLRSFGTAYVTLVRNTPLTLIVFFCAFGLYNTPGSAAGAGRARPPPSPTTTSASGVVALAVYHAAFVAEALRSGINTVPQGQAEAARAIGLPFLPTLTNVILPQAFRGAIAPLGNVMIALTKNTTVVATVGVAEASYLMRSMIEFDSSLLFAIFIDHGHRLRDPHPADGRAVHHAVPAPGGAAMSAGATVLFDAPGPEASGSSPDHRCHRRWSCCCCWSGRLPRSGQAGERPVHRREVAAVPGPGVLDGVPPARHRSRTLLAAAIAVVLSRSCFGILLGMGRLSGLAAAARRLRCLRRVLPAGSGADDDAVRLLLRAVRPRHHRRGAVVVRRRGRA